MATERSGYWRRTNEGTPCCSSATCPGTALAEAKSVDPIAVVIDLLPRLWKPAGPPFKTLGDEA